MPTLVACTGFEYGTHAGLGFGPFDGVTGTLGTDVQVIAGAAYEGIYGLQVALTAKGPFWTTTALGAAKTSLVVSLRVRFSTLPTTDTDFISVDVAATTDRAGFFYRASDAKIVAWAGASTQVSAAAVSVNTWYLLQWHLDVSANPLLMSWSLDGVAGTQVSLGVAASTISRLQLGNRSVGTGTAQYDAVVVSTTGADYPLGAHSIKILSVDPVGTVTTNSATNFRRFTANGTIDGVWSAADARDAVDELPPTIGASADGAVQISNNVAGYMEFPMTTYTLVGGETIAGLRMLACGWAGDATPATIEFRSHNGITETVVYALADPGFDASTVSPAWVAAMCTLADFDTQTELDALAFRVGFSSDAAPDIGIHAIYAELAVKEATASDVPWDPRRSIQPREAGEVQWLQRDRRDANTVASAVDDLPSPLDVAFGAGGPLWHQRGGAADAASRVWQIQQRTYLDPSLLSPAPAEPAPPPTRTVPVRDYGEAQWLQRVARDQITTALLEGPLLTGDLRQRSLAAFYADRREVPQQRAYISDPSFYPTATPTDPLTLTFGTGGTYWLLYNTAALQVDRRNVPQQPRYISDPSALATALLEGVLLGGGREGNLAAYTDRRATALPRPVFDLSLLDTGNADPTTLAAGVGGDMWRRVNTAAYIDRRDTPAQPPRVTLSFDAGPGSPPLTLAWGVGGNHWHLYNPRRPGAAWWRTAPVFALPADHLCVTPRPSTGITVWSTTTTARPDTGVTSQPC